MSFILGPDGNPVSSQQEQSAPTFAVRGANIPANPSIAEAWGPGSLDPGLRGGWMYADPTGRPAARLGKYGLNRDAERYRARSAYFLNPLFQGAVRIAMSFLIGDQFSYGEVKDNAAATALEEFWQANNLGWLISERWLKEYFLDGENATVFPQGDADPGPDTPARIAFLDMDIGVRVESDTASGTVAADMVTALHLRSGLRERTWNQGEFVWTANDALWNDPRGFPLVSGAVDPAMAYIGLANLRWNIHEIQQRIVAVYTAMLNPAAADGGAAEWRAKGGAFRSVPPKGAVVPLIVKPGYTDKDGNRYDGVRETLEFPRPASGASDAKEDMGVFLRLVGLCMGGLPEHWLMEGGNVNRATAGEMSLPAVRLALQRQATLRFYLDRLMRTELKRRFGPDRKYRIPVRKIKDKGLTAVDTVKWVTADLLEFPWNLPSITVETLETTLKVVLALAAKGWASDQTLAARLGVDVPTEVELMAAAGRTFGQTNAGTAPTPPTPMPPANSQEWMARMTHDIQMLEGTLRGLQAIAERLQGAKP